MKMRYLIIFALALIILTMGVASASDVGNLTAEDNVDILDSVDESVAAEEDGDVIGDDYIKTHVELNSYDIISDNPHSVNIYNDSDYVAKIYAPTESEGSVSLSIGSYYGDAYEIFNEDIQSLNREIDENDTYFSNFYIRPGDIIVEDVPNVHYVLVEYKYGGTFEESAEGYVNFVEDSRHVRVEAPPEIVIGNDYYSYIQIYVEGVRGNLRVLIDNNQIINDSVFNLKYDNETGGFLYYIPIFMDNLAVGSHTYNVSYYGGNWDNVTISDTIDVTYRLDVIVWSDEICYGDNVTFLILLPDDASSNEIKVNNQSYWIDVEYGLAVLTLSDFNFGENILTFTYDDVKYGEKSSIISIQVDPKLYIPSTIRYGSDDKIILMLPSDAQGKLNISVDDGEEWILKDSVDVFNGEADYTFDSSWGLGSYYILAEFSGDKYSASKESWINIVPNVEFEEFSADGAGNMIFGLPEKSSGILTVYVNNETVLTTPVQGGKTKIHLSGLKTGYNNVTVFYRDYNGKTYETNETVEVPKSEPKVDITTPSDSTVPQFTITLPSDATGTLYVYVNAREYVCELKNGEATITIPDLADGTYDIIIYYSGDAKYGEIIKMTSITIKTVDLKDPKLTIQVPSIYQGKNAVITITTDNTFTGKVNVKIGSLDYVVNVVNGKGTATVSGLKVGTYTATAIFAGTERFKSATKSVKFKVNANVIKLTLKKVKVKKSAKRIKITATLKINGKNVKGKKLKFKFNKKVYRAKTNKKGIAKVIIKKNILKKLKVGKKIRYQVSYGKKTVKRTVKVLK